MKTKKIFKMLAESQSDIKLIKEAYDPSKPQLMKFNGVFLVSEAKNGNGRIYPYETLKAEVDRFRTEMIETDRAISELEHPSSAEIDPTRACARILSLTEDNKTWVGEAVVLCSDPKFGIKGTVCGDTLAALINYGTKFGVSSRALGDVNEDGVVTDLKLVTIDTVLNPSIGIMVTSDGSRFVNGILESKSWVCGNHGELVESKFNSFEKKISKLPNTCIKSKKDIFLANAVNEFFTSLTA